MPGGHDYQRGLARLMRSHHLAPASCSISMRRASRGGGGPACQPGEAWHLCESIERRVLARYRTNLPTNALVHSEQAAWPALAAPLAVECPPKRTQRVAGCYRLPERGHSDGMGRRLLCRRGSTPLASQRFTAHPSLIPTE